MDFVSYESLYASGWRIRNIKNNYEFQGFLLRGKIKVKLEILLLCMGYNVNRYHVSFRDCFKVRVNSKTDIK